jgi:hypothetical protein
MRIFLCVISTIFLLSLVSTAQAIPIYYVFNGHVTDSTCSDVVNGELFSGKLQFERSLTDPYSGIGWLDIRFDNGIALQSNNLINIDNNDLWYQVWGTGFNNYYSPDSSYISIDSKIMCTELLTSAYTGALIFASIDNIYDPVPEPSTLLLVGFGLVGIGCFRKKSRDYCLSKLHGFLR